MTTHGERRRLMSLFCQRLVDIIAEDDEIVGAFVLVMKESGRAAAYYTPIPTGQGTVVVAEITKTRNVMAEQLGVTDAMLRRQLHEAARLDDGQFEGRA